MGGPMGARMEGPMGARMGGPMGVQMQERMEQGDPMEFEFEEVPMRGGPPHACMLFMVGLLLMLSATMCCCCSGWVRSNSQDFDDATVDVVGVDAYTPLMDTVIQDENCNVETPLMPLAHEEPIKFAKTVV
mmetsp:Transcript_35309/g.49023  ORF Transcript_35309/g.49023 Transcript_35309/m.49023 type:complete len:131 (-) Transcript_35309:225-617(-)